MSDISRSVLLVSTVVVGPPNVDTEQASVAVTSEKIAGLLPAQAEQIASDVNNSAETLVGNARVKRLALVISG